MDVTRASKILLLCKQNLTNIKYPFPDLQKSQNVAKNRGEVNFTPEILIGEVCENLKFLLKKVRGGFNFTKEILLNKFCDKTQNFA